MNEQVELWPKPIMYGTGFKITTPGIKYIRHEKSYRDYLRQFVIAMREAMNETIPKVS